jgi:hypothetical protein
MPLPRWVYGPNINLLYSATTLMALVLQINESKSMITAIKHNINRLNKQRIKSILVYKLRYTKIVFKYCEVK